MIPLNTQFNQNGLSDPAITSSYNVEYMLEIVFERFSKGLRIIGPIFAFALTLFILIVIHSFFGIILPFWTNKFGLFIGCILTILALFLFFSILFNYFLAVLVRPGSIEDIRKSKFYRKTDPLATPSCIINFNSVFMNPTNKSNSKDDKNDDISINFKLRLKVGNNSDNINKENDLLSSANKSEKRKINTKETNYENETDINDLLSPNETNFKSETTYNSNIINNSNKQSLPEDDEETFKQYLDDKLNDIQSLPNDNLNYTVVDKSFQEKEISEYYGLKNNNTDLANTARLSDCKYCKAPKVFRSHHCSICGYCVMKMDHHCPWINNCVGQNNHRYFVLFLTHLFFGTLFITITSIPIVFNTSLTKTAEFNFMSVLSFVGLILMIFFNSWNWFLVYKGNTTIEYWTIRANFNFNSNLIKDYSMPNWRDNIFIVFGTRSLLKAIFIPNIKRLPYSGLEWTRLSIPSYNFEIIEYEKNEEMRISKLNNEMII